LKAKEFLKDDTFLTINVDILTELNLKYFLSFHQQQQSLITLAVSDRKTSRYLIFNKYNRLCGWRNKTTGEEKIVIHAPELNEKAYSGIAVFEPSVFESIQLSGKFSLIDLYLSLAVDNKIAGFEHSSDRLIDVGKPENVERAEQMFT
jgi:NDP-sugar pyrophosphorylase family protein